MGMSGMPVLLDRHTPASVLFSGLYRSTHPTPLFLSAEGTIPGETLVFSKRAGCLHGSWRLWVRLLDYRAYCGVLGSLWRALRYRRGWAGGPGEERTSSDTSSTRDGD